MARDGTLTVRILGDSNQFSKTLAGASTQAGAFGGKLKSLAVVGVGAFAAIGAAAGVAAFGLFKIGESFDEASDKIRVGTGATGEALEGLEDSFKNVVASVPASFGDASTAIADLNTRLGLTGEPLEDIAEQMLNLSRITETDLEGNVDNLTRVFGDWEVAAEDMPDALDQIYRASQASGIGLDDLSSSVVQFGAPLRNLGFGFEESLALLGQFNKTGVNTETVFAGLKIGVGKLAKEGEDIPDTFKRVVDEITALGPGSDATGKAIELFGQRAGPDLADAIAGGKFEIEGILDAITGGEDTINGAAKDTESFGEKWTLLKNRVLVGLEPLATKVFDGVGKAMDDLGPKVAELAAWFEENVPPALEKVQTIAADVFPKVQAFVSGLVSFVQRNWPQIAETITSYMDTIRSAIEGVLEIVTRLWNTFGDNILNYVQQAFDAIAQVVGAVMQVIQGVVETVMGIIHGDWTEAWNGIKKIFGGVWDAILGLLKLALAQAKLVIGAAWDVIQGIFDKAWTAIKDSTSKAIDAVVDFITGGLTIAKEFVTGTLDSIVDFFKKLPGRLRDVGKGAFDWLINAFKAAANFIIDGLNSIKIGSKTIGGWDIPGPGPNVPSFTTPEIDPFPHIPRLHDGGTLTRAGMVNIQPDEELVTLPKGATVTPLDNGPTSQVNYFYITNPVPETASESLYRAARTASAELVGA